MKTVQIGIISIMFVLLFSSYHSKNVEAQDSAIHVSCGTILKAELTAVEKGTPIIGNEPHKYSIDLLPGDKISIEVTPTGATSNFFFRLFNPEGQLLYDTSWGAPPGQPDRVKGFAVDATGRYFIGVGADKIGAYTLSIGCSLASGKIINPGDKIAQPTKQTNVVPAPANNSFSGVGFPGLPPVDFSKAAKIPLQTGTNNGAMTPTGGEIVAFTMDGKANSSVELTFTRVSGNLNLGLVMLSADNKVVFQASLVSSDMIFTQIKLPADGKYTIGVFRIDLIPPTGPQPTAFQVQAQVK